MKPSPSLKEVRAMIRSGAYNGQTSGMAPGHVQGNLAILPKDWADDFLRFCHFNPKPCPLIGMTEPGDPRVPMLGEDIDLRTDAARYRIWRHGELEREVDDIRDVWTDDLVGFVIGCSFSFEQALLDAGIPLPHIEQGRSVAMYYTNIECMPAGRFRGNMVVSMRAMTPANAIRAIQVCSRFPSVHGAPVHFGDPEAIGIRDINQPDQGDVVDIPPGQVPVFWACGVTPQLVLRDSKPPFCITHAPGAMLITDILNNQLASF